MTDDGAISKKTKKREKEVPIPGWVRLQELARKGLPKAALASTGKSTGPGRPRNPFKRHQVHITLTDEEEDALDQAVAILLTNMKGINRGMLTGFMANYLLDQLRNVDTSKIKSFEDLIIFLEQNGEVNSGDNSEGT